MPTFHPDAFKNWPLFGDLSAHVPADITHCESDAMHVCFFTWRQGSSSTHGGPKHEIVFRAEFSDNKLIMFAGAAQIATVPVKARLRTESQTKRMKINETITISIDEKIERGYIDRTVYEIPVSDHVAQYRFFSDDHINLGRKSHYCYAGNVGVNCFTDLIREDGLTCAHLQNGCPLASCFMVYKNVVGGKHIICLEHILTANNRFIQTNWNEERLQRALKEHEVARYHGYD